MKNSSEPIILVINPGSTSTKVALFSGGTEISEKVLVHSKEDLSAYNDIWDQFDFRLSAILAFLQNLSNLQLSAVVGRGGLLKPLKRGTYRVSEAMLQDARRGVQGEHISNLGCAMADRVASRCQCPAYTVDPVSVDEFEPIARYSGHPAIQRRALAHTLSLRASAIWAAEKLNLSVDRSSHIVVHLGGGISVAPIINGQMVDVNDASSDGPFSPERTGGLPLQPFIDLCFSGKYTKAQIRKMVMGEGGLIAYLGTNDLKEVEKRIEYGDEKASEVYNAMIYQISKEIGAMAAVLHGKVDAIVVTGGLAHSEKLVQRICDRVSFIAPVITLAGELEMEAMASGVLRVLKGEEEAREY